MTYASFLERKRRGLAPGGITLDPCQIHPALFPFQRELVTWALGRGRACLFADTGLGKTLMQLEWAHHAAARALIVAPLAVAQQTIREADRLLGRTVTYARSEEEAPDLGLTVTNYERLAGFDPARWPAVVLDESSILKSFDGETRRTILAMFQRTPYKLACTATPAPNDTSELTSHAEFVGAMTRAEMLAAYFVHDDDGWRLKGHAEEPMYRWMATWAAALRRPSDLGYDDTGYTLPPLNIHAEVVPAPVQADGQLFATDLGGVGGRHAVRRQTLDARVERTVELIKSTPGEQCLVWAGLNDEARAVTAAIPGAVNVEGAWTPEQKTSALLAFQAGDITVMVTKSKIAGLGMNFQNCHRMVFVGLNDSYEAYYQAIRRCWRYGQTKPVHAHVVVSDLEQEIVANVRRKEIQAARSTDSLIRHINAHRETELAERTG